MIYIYQIANVIYRSYKNELETSNYQEHLPKHIVMLFQDFKRAYDSKNIKNLSNRISDSFTGDIYGKDKPSFIKLMTSLFNSFGMILNPSLRIQIDAKPKLFNIPLPINYDQGKLICEAKPEGTLNY